MNTKYSITGNATPANMANNFNQFLQDFTSTNFENLLNDSNFENYNFSFPSPWVINSSKLTQYISAKLYPGYSYTLVAYLNPNISINITDNNNSLINLNNSTNIIQNTPVSASGFTKYTLQFKVPVTYSTNTVSVNIGTTLTSDIQSIALYKGTIELGGVFTPDTLRNSNNTTNTYFGLTALNSITSGTYNSAFGDSALLLNDTGSYNIAVGPSALYSNKSGDYNIAVGQYALDLNNTGSYNIAVGHNALSANVSGGNNYFFSKNTGSANINNAVVIGGYTGAVNDNDIIISDGAGNIGLHISSSGSNINMAFSGLSSHPTTVSGYGITDVASVKVDNAITADYVPWSGITGITGSPIIGVSASRYEISGSDTGSGVNLTPNYYHLELVGDGTIRLVITGTYAS